MNKKFSNHMNFLEKIKHTKGIALPFSYMGLCPHDLKKQDIINILAYELERIHGFTWEWKKTNEEYHEN